MEGENEGGKPPEIYIGVCLLSSDLYFQGQSPNWTSKRWKRKKENLRTLLSFPPFGRHAHQTCIYTALAKSSSDVCMEEEERRWYSAVGTDNTENIITLCLLHGSFSLDQQTLCESTNQSNHENQDSKRREGISLYG